MDKTIIQPLEQLFYRKIMLYSDLLDCFKKEREALVHMSLDELWSISGKKEEICSEIESLRQEIVSLVDPEADQKVFNLKEIMGLIPRESIPKFQTLSLRLMKLKGEIEALWKDNMALIDDSLHFIHEMISIITGGNQSKTMYNDRCHLSTAGANILLSREV